MSIITQINSLCKEKNTNFAEVERNTGISNGQIRRWNISSPKIENIQKVADYFQVSTDFLLGRTENKYIDTEQCGDLSITLEELIHLMNNNELIFKGRVLNENSRTVLKTSFENIYNIADILSTQKNNEK